MLGAVRNESRRHRRCGESGAARVLAYAHAHHYRADAPGYLLGDRVLGYEDSFVADFGPYRAVFTYTHTAGVIFRHLTVSVPSDNFHPSDMIRHLMISSDKYSLPCDKYAAPVAVCEIAAVFGFTGYDPAAISPDDWLAGLNYIYVYDGCVTVLQPVGSDVPREAMS